MIETVRLPRLFALTVTLSCAGCDKGSSNAAPVPVPPPPPQAQSATEPVASVAPPPPAPKADPVDSAALAAGLAVMTPRIKAKAEGLAKIEPTLQSRLFMHPGESKPASIEFDTKGLNTLDMAPFIQDFGSNHDCLDNPEAGIVDLAWSTTGGKKNHLKVDRNYTGTVTVNLAGASKLKLEVDKGNDNTLCDWFSVGFLNVK